MQNKLEPGIKQKWIDGLRSGNYLQTSLGLYDKNCNGYCCLGVLASICGYSNDKLHNQGWLHPKNFVNTPEILQSRYANENSLAARLAEMNDKGDSFNTIANWIDENL